MAHAGVLTPEGAADGSPRWLAGFAVLVLHLVALWWWAHSVAPDRPAVRRYATVRLVPRERPRSLPVDAAQPPRPAAVVRAGAPPTPARPSRRSAEEALPAHAITPDTAGRPAAGEPAAAPEPAASGASQPEPLNLLLRPGWRAGQGAPGAASGDRRVQAAPATPEQRMTQALGTAAGRSEEVLADGSRRIREGGNCLLIRPNRAAMLFPLEPSAARLPRAVDRCD